MRGQFYAQLKDEKGNDVGTAVTTVDPDRSEGHVVYHGNNAQPQGPRVGRLQFDGIDGDEVTLTVSAYPDYELAYRIPEDRRLAPTTKVSAKLKRLEGGRLYEGSWSSPAENASGTIVLLHMWRTDGFGGPVERFEDWGLYKSWADRYVNAGCAFRGQAFNRLTSTFHRTGRVDLVRYAQQDLPQFVDYLDTLTGRTYDLSKPDDFGAVLGLAQHHGFPTPLLDWTYSPYVAAYFAFAQVVEQPSPPETVRIYRLSSNKVADGLANRILHLASTDLAVVAFRPSSRGNARLLNQQGLFTLSNVADMDTYMRWMPEGTKESAIEYVEISSRVARHALADLRNMGTTAATLFPGLDGSSTFLKHLLFYGH